ncbi:MAG: class I SAM-dependent methyltransferase [Acidobacteria bacterium]|nr:class I SAM-dependent methyltransferase [Acidobacteriota bacterium]
MSDQPNSPRDTELTFDVPEMYWHFDEASAMVATQQPKVACILKWCGSGLVLDLGCNDGGIASRIGQNGTRVVAADQWPYVQAAHSKYGLPAVAFDANDPLPFASGKFDAVVVSGLLEYLNAPVALLSEVKRILKPTGRVVVIAPNRDSFWRRYHRWKGLPPRPEARFSLRDCRRMLAEAGFNIRTYRGCAYRRRGFPGRLIYLLERLLPSLVTDFGFLCEPSRT